MAIYLGENKLTGTGVQVDDAINSSSTNPVQNKVVAEALSEIGYSEWQKPEEWVDIRSGAFENSVYLLVGHSADYSSYPQFSVFSNISNSGTYDIYVDGVKQATTASGTETVLTWQNLALESGWDVTYPAALRTHIVRVTPSVPSNKIVGIRLNQTASYSENVSGVLWAHFSLDYAIDIQLFAGSSYKNNSPILETITSKNGLLKVTSCSTTFRKSGLKHFATTLDCSNLTGSANALFMDCSYLQGKVFIKNLPTTLPSEYYNRMFENATSVEGIVFDGGCVQNLFYVFNKCNALKEIKGAIPSNSNCSIIYWTENTSYEKPLYLYLSQISNAEKFDLQKNPMLKGITVSNEAPFSGASPQINVSNTGLDRAALVNLFKSMPYNVGYTITGTGPTVTDGILTGVGGASTVYTSQSVPSFETFELVTKVKKNGLSQNDTLPALALSSTVADSSYRVVAGGVLSLRVGSSTPIVSLDNFPYETLAGEWFYIKLNVAKNVNNYDYSIGYSTDKQNWTTGTGTSSSVFTQGIGFLRNSSGNGGTSSYMDLNETYITVNGVPWFTGKAAMTKTCSIVGCTGTADLTQADKDIALDKGWSLTVA